MTLLAGTRLGAYEILSPLGAGGMGEVYRAKDFRLGRDVAIKVLAETVAGDAERLARFEREARALAALNHPGIVTIFAVEEFAGTRFLAMELVEGDSLDTVIPSGGLPLDRFFDIATPLAEALSAAHERGIVHRDLKPGNVMVARDGRVKVLDFGLARVEAPDSDPNLTSTPTESRVNLTGEGQVFGTVAYMSPEQTRGGKVDARSDVFSLGVVLYQMLTGTRPFQGATAVDLISSILRDRPPSVTDLRTDVPPHLSRILRRCLEKDPRDRYQTSRDVYNELKGLRAETVPDSPASKVSSPSTGAAANVRSAPGASEWRRRAWLAVFAVILLGSAAYLVTRSRVGPAVSRAPEPGKEGHAIRSIAVLPLDNYSGDPNQDYFAEGMTDELTADLATISQLRVISRGSAMQFKGKNRPPTPEIAKTLNVDAIVEGSVIRAGDKVRITAQLIDARADRHLWAKSFERSSRDVLALQDELASAIAQRDPRSADSGRAVAADARAERESRGVRRVSQGPVLLQPPERREPEEGDRAIRRGGPARSELCPGVLGTVGRLPLGRLQRRRPDRLARRGPRPRPPPRRRSQLDDNSAEAHTSLAGLQDLLRIRLGGLRARIPPGVRAQPELRVRARSVRPRRSRSRDGSTKRSPRASARPSSIRSPRRFPPTLSLAVAWQGNYAEAREHGPESGEPRSDVSSFLRSWRGGSTSRRARSGDAIPKLEKAKAMGAPAFVSAWLAYAYGATGDRAARWRSSRT